MRSSPLHDEDRLRKLCAESYSIKEVLDKLGLRAAGGNYKQLKMYAEKFGITLPQQDAQHLQRKTEGARQARKVSDELVFCAESEYTNRYQIKRRLRAMGWKWICSTDGCGVSEEWLGKPMSLQLDHINGIHNDNRIENLRLLCPNCHSQTETFAGRKGWLI